MKRDLKKWAISAVLRLVRTAAQTTVAVMGGSAVMGDVKWMAVGSSALLAAILSLITSLGELPEVEGREE